MQKNTAWCFKYNNDEKDASNSKYFQWKVPGEEERTIEEERKSQEQQLVFGLEWVWERHNVFRKFVKDPAAPTDYPKILAELRESFPVPA